MKRAVSISLGSSKRDKRVEVAFCGERVVIERIGTDGDMEKAAQKYRDLDGKVDATYVDEATGKYSFYFEDTEEIRELVRRYYDKELLVEPVALFNARKELLTRIKHEGFIKNANSL